MWRTQNHKPDRCWHKRAAKCGFGERSWASSGQTKWVTMRYFSVLTKRSQVCPPLIREKELVTLYHGHLLLLLTEGRKSKRMPPRKPKTVLLNRTKKGSSYCNMKRGEPLKRNNKDGPAYGQNTHTILLFFNCVKKTIILSIKFIAFLADHLHCWYSDWKLSLS